MTDQPDELFAAVDSLLAAVDGGTVLPVPAERTRLREAAGLTRAAVAQALGVRVPSIEAWEAGRAEPRGERLEAYRRLLAGLADRCPAADRSPAAGRGDGERAARDAPLSSAGQAAVVRVDGVAPGCRPLVLGEQSPDLFAAGDQVQE
ncbi:helix-turn-helix transcriptional regulator, partial [Streptomyces sp. NPDC004542]|uniref:helix-turn-helix domain-containing protein n=1 Tax=Streptomyces sp. NPDC004542 TaxID=3154281 RepID=UPI0033AC9905